MAGRLLLLVTLVGVLSGCRSGMVREECPTPDYGAFVKNMDTVTDSRVVGKIDNATEILLYALIALDLREQQRTQEKCE